MFCEGSNSCHFAVLNHHPLHVAHNLTSRKLIEFLTLEMVKNEVKIGHFYPYFRTPKIDHVMKCVSKGLILLSPRRK